MVAMHMRLLKSDFLTVPGSAILQYGGYYGGRMVKSLRRYKYSFFKLLKSKNEWHQWKELKKLAKKAVRFPMFGCTVFEIWWFENHEKC